MGSDRQEPLLTPDQGSASAAIAGSWPPQLLGSYVWDGYDEDEDALRHRLRFVDIFGLPIILALYVALAWSIAPRDITVPRAPFEVVVFQGLCAIIVSYVAYLDSCTISPLKLSPDVYGCVQGPLGRYIWLTRQTIAMQAVHEVVTFFSQVTGCHLLIGTYVLSPVVSSLGTFVTIQFFTLCYPEENFKRDCELWRGRGYHFKEIVSGLHTPQLVVAIADICVLRSRQSLLLVMPSLLSLFSAFLVYALAYVVVLHWNYGRTGQWPYGFLEPLGRSVAKWGQFTLVQSAILAIFGIAMWGLAHVTPAFW